MTNCPCNATSFQDMTRLEALLRHIVPVVPDLPHSMALDRLRQAYIEFARRSGLLLAKLVLDYQAGVSDYELVPPDGYEIYMVQGVQHHNGFYWYDGTAGYIGGLQNTWGNVFPGNTGFVMTSNRTLCLNNTPTVDQVGGLNVYVTLLPTECVSDIPVAISVPFGDGIAKKVISDALRIPNKGWTNPVLARSYELEYNRTVLNAKQLASRNLQRGPLVARSVRIL